MMGITESFIDQVIYHRVSALALKGSVYTSLHVQDLIEFKKQTVGENILIEIERAADDVTYLAGIDSDIARINQAIEKIELLGQMDGMDSEPGPEAVEIFFAEVMGVTND